MKNVTPSTSIPKNALGNSLSKAPCPDCAHDLPGEIMRCPGVYSLCPTCHGKGYLDGEETKGITLGNALQNLADTRTRVSKYQNIRITR